MEIRGCDAHEDDDEVFDEDGGQGIDRGSEVVAAGVVSVSQGVFAWVCDGS